MAKNQTLPDLEQYSSDGSDYSPSAHSPLDFSQPKLADLTPEARQALGEGVLAEVIITGESTDSPQTFNTKIPRELLLFTSRHCRSIIDEHAPNTVILQPSISIHSLEHLATWMCGNTTSRTAFPIAIPPNPLHAAQAYTTATRLGITEAADHLYTKLSSRLTAGSLTLTTLDALVQTVPASDRLCSQLITSLAAMLRQSVGLAAPDRISVFERYLEAHPALWDYMRGEEEFRAYISATGQEGDEARKRGGEGGGRAVDRPWRTREPAFRRLDMAPLFGHELPPRGEEPIGALGQELTLGTGERPRRMGERVFVPRELSEENLEMIRETERAAEVVWARLLSQAAGETESDEDMSSEATERPPYDGLGKGKERA